MKKLSQGFSLIEMLIVISIIGIIGAVSLSTYVEIKEVYNSEQAKGIVIDLLREASLRAKVLDGDSNWGVYVRQEEVTLFRGEDYDSRDEDFDRRVDLPESVSVGGLVEVVYQKFLGMPNDSGVITFTNNYETQQIIIHNSGLIE